MTGNESSQFFQTEEYASMAADGFTHFTDIPTQGHNRLVRAMRYDRWWVLKGLKEECCGQAIYEVMLRKEFSIAVTMQHPNIASAFSFEHVAGIGSCIVMEWVDGITLGQWLQNAQPCPCKAMRRHVLMQLLDAVEYVHSRQVVHRDIKPSNILITRNGEQVKLIDFGLSDSDSHAAFKQSAGTRGYISPEQLEGGSPDQRNDIYSLGCVLDDLNLGRAARRIARRCQQPIGQRYASVAELRRAIERASQWPRMAAAAAIAILAAALIALAAMAMPLAAGSSDEPAPGEPTEYNDKIKVDNIFYKINHVQNKTLDVIGAIPDSLGHVDIPATIRYGGEEYRVQVIGEYAFERSHLRSVSIPATVEIIGQFAFYGNDLTEVTLPESTWSVLRGAFHDCKQLRRITFGSHVGVIDIDAFNGCDSLRHIVIPTPEPPVLGTFSKSCNTTVHVPAASVELYRQSQDWSGFGEIVAIEGGSTMPPR